jgi:predicted phosphodiesterase
MDKHLLWVTDPHLNFLSAGQTRALGEIWATHDPSAPLVITGDVSEGPVLLDDLRELAAGFTRPIYFVLGNHDYYRSSWRAVHRELRVTSLPDNLTFLDRRGPIRLDETTALVGQGGWYDGGYGNARTTPVMLNDFRRIAELGRCRSRGALLTAIQSRAEFDADETSRKLAHARRDGYRRVVFATHVPPFPEAALRDGEAGGPDHLPWFTSGLMGTALDRFCAAHADVDVLVLCGHTHSAADHRPRPNLRVCAGRAVYGAPALAGAVQLSAKGMQLSIEG